METSDTTGSGSTPIQPAATNTFSVSDVLQPGASTTINVFADTGSATLLGSNVYAYLTVASIGQTSNISSAGTSTQGQHISVGTGSISASTGATLLTASSTPTQYIASGATGLTNGSQMAINFIATSGSATVNELKFAVTTGGTAVSNICVGTVCASPINNGTAYVADLTGLSLAVPNGAGGLPVTAQISYIPVGTVGLTPGSSVITKLAYVKYVAGGTTTVNCSQSTIGSAACPSSSGSTTMTTVTAPTLTLQGSLPTVSIPTQSSPSPITAGSSAYQQIGAVTVTASTAGAVKVNEITFSLGSSGFNTTPAITGAKITVAGSSTAIPNSSCSLSGTTITCLMTGTAEVSTPTNQYTSDFPISPAGTSQTFNLYGILSASQTSGVTAKTSVSVTASGFIWDDTSDNGQGGYGADYGLTGSSIYNWPSNNAWQTSD